MKKIYLSFFLSCILYISSFAQTLIPVSNELILPQYAYYGAASNARLHYACRLTLTGLTPSTQYRYSVGISSSATTPRNAGNTADVFAPGHFYTVSSTALIGYATRQGLNGTNVGTNAFLTGGTNATNYYGVFTTDGSGNYTGWFMTIPTGNATHHGTGTSDGYFYVQLTPAAGAGFNPTISYRTTSTIKLLNYTADAAGVTALVGDSDVGPEKFVSLYDNDAATGRPLYTTFTEDDGINISTSVGATGTNAVTDALAWTTWYNLVDANTNGWGAIIPNTLPNGVRVIRYTNIDGTSAGADRISVNGTFGSVSTVNPTGGTTAINLDPTTLPVQLINFTGSSNENGVKLNWTTASETNNQYFEILRAGEDKNFISIGKVNGSGNSSTSKSYSFDDFNPATGNNYYQLKQVDFDGKSASFAPIAVSFGLTSNKISLLSSSDLAVTISISSATDKEAVISYVGLDGKIIYQQKTYLKAGLNSITLPVNKSAGNIGIISVSANKEQQSIKISR